MRKSCLKPDKELIEELCNKYGEDVRNAVTDAIISKNEDFQKVHKPICDIEDFKEYHRHLIQLRPDVAMLIHIFHMDDDDTWESIWLRDNNKYSIEDFDCIKESAHQLILQLEGNWCDLFIEALRDECNQILEDSNRKKETLLQKKSKCRTIKTTNRICPKSIKKI
jgi:hypothetical protein